MKDKLNKVLKWLGGILVFILTIGGALVILRKSKVDTVLNTDDLLKDQEDEVSDKIDDIKKDLDDIVPDDLSDDDIKDYWSDL